MTVAVKNIGYVLENASEKLKGDFNIVMAVMKHCGWALKYASKEL